MLDSGHRAAAQLAWLGLAASGISHVGPLELFLGAAMASATASNDYSPDADQRGLAARLLPGGHRGPTHMPEIVGACCWVLVHLTMAGGYGWMGWAVSCGWVSHVVVDAGFGRVPFLLFAGRRMGFAGRTGGRLEKALTRMMWVGCLPVAIWALAQSV